MFSICKDVVGVGEFLASNLIYVWKPVKMRVIIEPMREILQGKVDTYEYVYFMQ